MNKPNIDPKDVHYEYNTHEYMLYYKDKPIGGSGIRKSARSCRSNLTLFKDLAEKAKRDVINGYEPRMQAEIKRIQTENTCL